MKLSKRQFVQLHTIAGAARIQIKTENNEPNPPSHFARIEFCQFPGLSLIYWYNPGRERWEIATGKMEL